MYYSLVISCHLSLAMLPVGWFLHMTTDNLPTSNLLVSIDVIDCDSGAVVDSKSRQKLRIDVERQQKSFPRFGGSILTPECVDDTFGRPKWTSLSVYQQEALLTMCHRMYLWHVFHYSVFFEWHIMETSRYSRQIFIKYYYRRDGKNVL